MTVLTLKELQTPLKAALGLLLPTLNPAALFRWENNLFTKQGRCYHNQINFSKL